MEEKKESVVNHAKDKPTRKATRIWGWLLIILPVIFLFCGAFDLTQKDYAVRGVALKNVWRQEFFVDEFMYYFIRGICNPLFYIYIFLGLIMLLFASLKKISKAVWALVYTIAVLLSFFLGSWSIIYFQTSFLGPP